MKNLLFRNALLVNLGLPIPDLMTSRLVAITSQKITFHTMMKAVDLVNSVYRLVRNYTLGSKSRLIKKLNGGEGRLLDVGCGTGSFLERCKIDGWRITGVETDATVRAFAQEKLVFKYISDVSEIRSNESFDVITLWHVLEHISDLNEAIRRLSMLLSANGTLLVAVPNSNSYDAKYFREILGRLRCTSAPVSLYAINN